MEIEVTKEELAQGGTRADKGKPRVDLIPPEVLIELGKLYEQGAIKYNENNWRSGMAYGRMYASTMRHLLAFWSGEDFDSEGQHHLDSVIWGAVGLRYFELKPEVYKEFDNRWKGKALAPVPQELLFKGPTYPIPEGFIILPPTEKMQRGDMIWDPRVSKFVFTTEKDVGQYASRYVCPIGRDIATGD